MLQFSPVGILAFIAVAMCWGLAVVLYRVGVPGSVARKLGLLLVVEGVTLVSTGYIDLFLSPSVQASDLHGRWLKAEEIIHTLGDCTMLALYPSFLAAALQTKLTRPFGGRRMGLIMGGTALALFFAVLTTPLEFGASLLYLLLSLLFGFALVASIHAWHEARGVARNRARSFAIAFGIRDVCWGLVYAWAILEVWSGRYQVVDPTAEGMAYVIYALGTLFAVPLIAYGILRSQLFDIDLRIRWTIKQSTLAGAIIAIAYLLSEAADRLLSAELGDWIGLLASTLVVFSWYHCSASPNVSPAWRCRTRTTHRNMPRFASYRYTRPLSPRPNRRVEFRKRSVCC